MSRDASAPRLAAGGDLAARLAEAERELAEARREQTATADILRVIASSPSDAQPVFDAIAESAKRLIGAKTAYVHRMIDGTIHLAAHTALPPEEAAAFLALYPRPYAPESVYVQVDKAGEPLAYPDVDSMPAYLRDYFTRFGYASLSSAPMTSLGRGLGAVSVLRSEGGSLPAHQIQLLQTFADQAVIAIENARLFNETQEALERQKATAEVLAAISKSVADTAPVFEAILDACERLFGAEAIGIYTIGGDDMARVAAWRGPWADDVLRDATPVGESVTGRIIRERRSHHIPDHAAEPNLSPTLRERVNRLGSASLLYAPMLWEDAGLGSIMVLRKPPRPFSEREQALLQSFADQAAIAIQNARLFEEVQARTRDLEESLAQQTATADVLKVISRSAFDLNVATSTILEAAAKLCRAPLGALHLRDGDVCRLATQFGLPEAFEREMRGNPLPVRYPLHSRRTARAGDIAHFADAWTDPEYLYKASARLGGYRAIVVIPLMREGELVGIFSLGRPDPEPFTESHIKLTQTFADQAAIAIENARLFNEVQAKTRDLEESLAQQTATADVLKAISRTAFNLDVVLETLISTAVRLCDATHGQIFRRYGEIYKYGASQMDVVTAYREHEQKAEIRAGRGTLVGRVALENRAVEIADAWTDPEYAEKDEARLGNVRAMLGVPLLRDGEPIGAFALARPTPGGYTPRQIELVQTFADQAVIAIENARLFGEVQARTRDLEEALDRQTATSEILRVISQSPTDAGPVFDRIVTTAARLLRCDYAYVILTDGKAWRPAAGATSDGVKPEMLPDAFPVDSGADFPSRAIASKAMLHLPDWSIIDLPAIESHVREILGAQSSLYLPFLREGACVGLLAFVSRRAHAFGPAEIAQAESFRDQALIAIENTRLFNETQEALQQQTATADVLKVISRSAFDLDAIFQTLVATAVDLCEAFSGTLCVRDGEVFRYQGMAGPGASQELQDYLAAHPITAPDRQTVAGRTILSKEVEHISDVGSDSAYAVPLAAHGNPARALLGVPLLGKERVEGALVLTRAEPGEFAARRIEILKTFADQAVIAIENARLFSEVQARTRELQQSLDDLRKTQDRLIQSEKLASLGQLTAGIAHEIKNPLNFINNFSALSRELMDELRTVLEKARLDGPDREEAGDLIGMIDANLDKVVNHGRRADSIVKNMLLHSREGSGERTSVDVNAMVEEALNLAYHGARAEKRGFNVTIEKALDPRAGSADLYLQEMTRVLLNLISNGFYATIKRKRAGADARYEPTILAATRDLGDRVEIAIRDNGTGIPDEVKAKMFNPFFTTKPAGEGTGLGLSLSHDIVVKQHGGTIEVATESSRFTEFTIRLPRSGALA